MQVRTEPERVDAEEAFEMLKPWLKKDLDADNSIDVKEVEEILQEDPDDDMSYETPVLMLSQ